MSHQRKIFIGLSLDEKSKQFISKKMAGLKLNDHENIRLVRPENYHITLMFLGYVKDEDVPDICLNLKKALKGVETFDISFGEIRKAPTEGNPKIIWLEGDFNPELTEIKNKTEEALSYQKGDFRKFAPHITLARIKKPKETLVGKNINKKINLMVPVRSVEIMESLMERGGRAYYMLDSVSLEE